jgi:hypothetical protein
MTTSAAITLPFRLGEHASFGGLGLIPLFPENEPRLDYIGLDEAVAHGLRITEVDHAGSVNDLAAVNPLDVGVLLYEGEELVGAKQNRVLDRPILVGANRKVRIAVNCVERGRWSYRSADFAPAPRAAHPTGRYAARLGGQGAVWSEIAAKSARLGAPSITEAAEEMYVRRSRNLEEYLRALPRRSGQCGTIVCLAGRVVCLDYVSRSEVFAGLYAKLLRGYALDAIEQRVDRPIPDEYVRVLLARLGRRRIVDGTIRGRGFMGNELHHDGETIALSMFPTRRA